VTWDWSTEALARLGVFLRERAILEGTLSTQPIGDGRSNLTFLVRDHSQQVILRRPPPPPIPPGAHDVLREVTLLAALADSPVPVPTVLATARAGEVLDVDFYVMSYAVGPIITAITPEPFANPASRAALGYVLVDTLADLHQIDWRAAGLAEFGKPEGFNLRHVRRMRALIADSQSGIPAHFCPVQEWLTERVPAESAAAIVHNDFRIGNVIYKPDHPPRIQAVLDWELATLGDPLLDLGYLIASVPERGEALTPTGMFASAMLEEGYPSRFELAQHYVKRTGADLSTLNWYIVMALWKLAVLYEYGRRRAKDGNGDSYYADESLVSSFLEAAHRTAGLPVPEAVS